MRGARDGAVKKKSMSKQDKLQNKKKCTELELRTTECFHAATNEG